MKKYLVLSFIVTLFCQEYVFAEYGTYQNSFQADYHKMLNVHRQQLQIQQQQQMQQMQQQQQMSPAMEKEYLRGMCYQNCNTQYGDGYQGGAKLWCMEACTRKYNQ